jgi:hypothetical protein
MFGNYKLKIRILPIYFYQWRGARARQNLTDKDKHARVSWYFYQCRGARARQNLTDKDKHARVSWYFPVISCSLLLGVTFPFLPCFAARQRAFF